MASTGELFTRLSAFWRDRQREIDEKWRRTVPFGDYVVDRWERARTLGWGDGASVYDSCLILGDVTVGDGTWVGPFTVLDGSGGLSIGAGCTIGAGSQIYTHDSTERTVAGNQGLPLDQGVPIQRTPTKVGNHVHMSVNVVVLMGVTIGDGAVIGPNSLVNRDIPAGATAFGTPARLRES